ncbi:ATP-dependent helicase [Patescibacteria group bacterium]|nr:ATP-dependent helicase [Patescibacteria group bacterium]MBU0776742.1 ATP-dependent helicase [Patescibacteria group bacterium]MBU0846315.1 ATP-dependent helicase [Patescibacteria group bacterium]MBU0922725.1 ATP-dependent helicase [Patescibacteria group bacterium]MBU1066242.1 ATP-dependent helicase [Patescibacteria group bacterium]
MTKSVGTKKLNKEQLEAIKYKGGPLLIIAGAGTGKTTVITERIKYLLLSKKVKPSEILALTFTEKASREMEERVDVVMPYGYTQMWISTFHSFCDRILRKEALHIGLDPKFRLMTQISSIQFVRKNLFAFDLKYFRPLGNPTKFVSGMLQHFSRLQDEDITPQEYLRYAKKIAKKKMTSDEKMEAKKIMELAKAYMAYNELKIKEGLMDFGDLIVKTLVLFRQRQNILANYQKQFKHILVDEFQDTNHAQNELAILLAGKSKNITVTGDDDQSIYRFRGAAVSNIIHFKKAYPKAKVVVLTKNYRSTQEILDKAYVMIQHNNPDRLEAVEKIDKRLISQRKLRGDDIRFIHADRVENEADQVVKEIIELTEEGKYDYKDFAILVRANNHSEPFMHALSRQGLPYQFLGPGRLFKQPEVIDLISYLKVLYNFEDSVAFYRLLSIDYFDIFPRDLIKIGNYARRFNLSIFETCEKIDSIFVTPETKRKIKKLTAIVNKHLKLAGSETAGQLVYYFLEETGLLQRLLKTDTLGIEKKARNISKFFDKLKTYETDNEDASVRAVVDWIDLSSELGESPLATDVDWGEVDAINILTVHSSKGLEFPVVFLVNLVGQRFPTVERREQIPIPDTLIKEILPVGDYHIEEERRLFYVGMTRAKDLIFFTAADYYGEGKRGKKLSPFIFEALGDSAVSAELATEKHEQLSFIDYKSIDNQESDSKIIKDKQEKIHVDYLSYSQIETFRICPLHYKLKYLYKIPTPFSAPLSFGISMHAALKDFYIGIKRGQRQNEKLILSALKDNWMSEGYRSKLHEKKMLDKGIKFLSDYYKKEFNSKIIPASLEESFVVPLRVPKGERPLKIGGKMDRVDILSGGKIEIVDYKTGAKALNQKEVDRDPQLTFYALAAANINEEPFGKGPDKIMLTLYYLDGQKKISTTRTRKQLEDAKKEIFIWRDKIEKSDFECSGHIFCQTCEYALLCRADSR